MKNEIRQGNYVSITPFEDETDILQLNEEEIENLYIFKNWDRIKPIPLTEEWFLKFGFESVLKGYNYLTIRKTSLYVYINDNGESGICIEDLDNNLTQEEELCFSIKIKYVHQLQNLYFALTNEELTIKK